VEVSLFPASPVLRTPYPPMTEGEGLGAGENGLGVRPARISIAQTACFGTAPQVQNTPLKDTQKCKGSLHLAQNGLKQAFELRSKDW